MMNDVDDWELTARAQGGDMHAFAALVTRFQAPVRQFCQHMLPVHREAEEAARETFVLLYSALPRLAAQAPFPTVLFGFARKAVHKRLPAKLRTKENGESPAPQEASEQALLDAITSLRPSYREAVLLRELQGMDYANMAAVLRCRPAAVKRRLARGREQLQSLLAQAGNMEL